MSGQLDGRVAVITGAGDGIGAGLARVFAREGARVVIGELNADTGRAMADELGDQGSFIRTNVGDRAQCEAMVARAVDHFGAIDILVDNAGVALPTALAEVDRRYGYRAMPQTKPSLARACPVCESQQVFGLRPVRQNDHVDHGVQQCL